MEISQGDIAAQKDIAAVVNAANAQLQSGGGIAGALHRAAGPGLAEECRPKAPITPGQAVITGGHQLPNAHVIHCLGPVYGQDKPSDQLLAACYENALALAERHRLDSIAFPAISTGAFGYPTTEAARVALQTVLHRLAQLRSLETIRFVLYDNKSQQTFEKVFAQLLDEHT